LLLRRGPLPASSSSSSSSMQLPDFSSISVPRAGSSRQTTPPVPASGRRQDDPAVIREMLAANPDQLALLKQNNVRLAEAYDSGSLEEFAKVLKEQYEARLERDKMRVRMLTADPFDMEVRTKKSMENETQLIFSRLKD